MDVVDVWTGARAVALCDALRMTYEEFAEKLGRGVSTVHYWRSHPDAHVRKDIAGELDVMLERASDLAQQLFWRQVPDTTPEVESTSSTQTSALITADAAVTEVGDIFSRPPPLQPESLTPELLRPLRGMFDQYVNLDRLIGARHMVEPIRQQATFVQRLAAIAHGEVRTDLLRLAAGWAEFCGWALHDAGNLAGAMAWTDRALGHIQELGDPQMLSYVLMRKSNIATDADQPGSGVGLATAALRTGNELSPLHRAVALRQQANGLALMGDGDECARALDGAMDAVASARDNPTGDNTDYCAPGYCTPAYIEMEAANCWLILRRPDKAIPIFERGLADWPAGTQERDRGLCLSRLATSHAVAGDYGAACATGLQAVTLVQQTQSGRTFTQLRQLRAQLTNASGGDVADLEHSLATLVELTN